MPTLSNAMNPKSRLEQVDTSATLKSEPIRVVVIEDMREVRDGLTALINGTQGFKCVGSYFSMELALTGIGNEAVDVILTDIGLPGMTGVRGTEILRGMYPDVPILALTVYDNDDK